MNRVRREVGSASMLVLTMVGVLTFVCLALLLCSSLVVSHRRTQAAADLAALAAASSLGDGTDPCAAAASVATANGARLATCEPTTSGDVTVRVALTDPATGIELDARARAGPGQVYRDSSEALVSSPWASASGAPASSRSSRRTAPCLSSGLFWLPHLGDWTHDGQPSAHSQAAMAARVARSQVSAVR